MDVIKRAIEWLEHGILYADEAILEDEWILIEHRAPLLIDSKPKWWQVRAAYIRKREKMTLVLFRIRIETHKRFRDECSDAIESIKKLDFEPAKRIFDRVLKDYLRTWSVGTITTPVAEHEIIKLIQLRHDLGVDSQYRIVTADPP